MLIAQLAFHGMPLRQGMILTRLIRLHQIQDDDIRRLFKTVMELPIRRFTGKRMAFTDLPCQSVGEVAYHIIHSGFLENFNLEEICCAIRAAGSAFTNQTLEVTSE